MKKLKLLLLSIISISYLSCEDAYKIEQEGEFTEDVTFLSVSDMDDYLNGVYAQATIISEIGFTSVFTDEVGIGNSSGGQNLDLYRYFLTNNDSYASSIWISHYAMINYANRLLRGAERITPAAAEVAEYNNIIAQAKALRAWGHFQLLSFYSADLKNDASLGVILMDRVPDLSEELPRNTTGEVFSFIESDLLFAEQNLVPRTGTTAYYYVSKNFINAMRARMYLYRGNYALAGQYADEVINNSGIVLTPAGTFTNNTAFYNAAATTSPYRKMWTDLIQGEIIFGLRRQAGEEAVAGLFYFNSTRLSGSPYHDMGRNLFNLLNDRDMNGNPANDFDIRRKAFIDPTSVVSANPANVVVWDSGDVLCIDKYPGRTENGTNLTNDLKVFRLSEMYFIKAEVLASAGSLNGDAGSVAAILKQIRDVRTYSTSAQPVVAQPLPVYDNASQAWADILKERRVELCFEGHRYIDLKRLGELANVTIDRYYRDCEANNVGTCNLPINDYRFRLPIPIDEIIGNSSIQQNPGY